MSEVKELMTAGDLAKVLGVSDAKVKKAIKDQAIEPKAKKGVCNYYGSEIVEQLRPLLSK